MSSRILWQEALGGPETLEVRSREVPTPGPGEVLVRVTAAGLNPVDWKLAEVPGLAELFGVHFPTGYGNDFAGVVEALGEGVEVWGVGDRVFGGLRGGALADHAVVAAAALTRTPDGLSDVDAAAIDALELGGDDTVLIGGGSGGVGTFAVQRAAATGARVIATASEGNHDYLTSLGAVPVTYGEGLVERVRELAPAGVDAAADLAGTEAALAALALGAPAGRITTIAAGPGGPDGTLAVGGNDARPGTAERIAEDLASGALRVQVETFGFDQFREAIDRLRTGHVSGKVVITIDS